MPQVHKMSCTEGLNDVIWCLVWPTLSNMSWHDTISVLWKWNSSIDMSRRRQMTPSYPLVATRRFISPLFWENIPPICTWSWAITCLTALLLKLINWGPRREQPCWLVRWYKDFWQKHNNRDHSLQFQSWQRYILFLHVLPDKWNGHNGTQRTFETSSKGTWLKKKPVFSHLWTLHFEICKIIAFSLSFVTLLIMMVS
jgi:hypothetical protein